MFDKNWFSASSRIFLVYFSPNIFAIGRHQSSWLHEINHNLITLKTHISCRVIQIASFLHKFKVSFLLHNQMFFLNEPHFFDHFMSFWNERSIILYFVLSVWEGSCSTILISKIKVHSHYCVCVKRITLCNCLCSSSPSSSRFSASAIWNIGEFGAKSYFTDHQRANTIHCFTDSVPVLKIYNCY